MRAPVRTTRLLIVLFYGGVVVYAAVVGGIRLGAYLFVAMVFLLAGLHPVEASTAITRWAHAFLEVPWETSDEEADPPLVEWPARPMRFVRQTPAQIDPTADAPLEEASRRGARPHRHG